MRVFSIIFLVTFISIGYCQAKTILASPNFQNQLREHLDSLADLKELNKKAVAYYKLAKYRLALPYAEECVELAKNILGENHPDNEIFLNNLAAIYKNIGFYSKAEIRYKQSISIHENYKDTTRIEYGRTINNLASLYFVQSQFHKAEPLFEKALNIFENELGKNHPDNVVIVNGLANVYLMQGQFMAAKKLYEKSLEICKEDTIQNAQNYASCLNNLGLIHENLNQLLLAKNFFKRALRIRKLFLGIQHPEYAMTLIHLAAINGRLGENEDHFVTYEDALEIFKSVYSKDHPYYATTLNELARFYKKNKNYTKAINLYEQSSEIFRNYLGKYSYDYASVLYNLGTLKQILGDNIEAENLYLKAYQANKSNQLNYFEISSPEQQLEYITKFQIQNEILFSFSYQHPQSKRLMSWLYNHIIFEKSLQLQTDLQLQNYLRQNTDTNLTGLYAEYLELKRQLILIESKSNYSGSNNMDLKEKIDNSYKMLARKSAEFRNFKDSFKISYQDIQQKLQPNEAAIEFVNFRYHDDNRWIDSVFYIALILRKEWDVPRMVFLGEQKEFQNSVDTGVLDTSIEDTLKIGTDLEENKTQQNRYDLIWKPIESLLAGVNKVYFSPSGLLYRMNLSSIETPIPNQKLMDKYDLVQLSSTRILATPENKILYVNDALLLGDIQYELDSTAYKKVNEKFAYRSKRGNRFGNLPYTATEISNASNILLQASFKVDTLKGLSASEEGFNFYSKQPSPRIIHLATHGFFLEDTITRKYKDATLSFNGEPIFITSSNPMLRSGLILAGGNNAWMGKDVPKNQADGILTAEEISIMNLRNTELVILSACDTGLGDINGTEGVFGLQRAFKIAGVKYLIMSLRQVSDNKTSQFMTEFYKQYLQENKSVRQAFKVATNKMRTKYPQEPTSWSSFILVE